VGYETAERGYQTFQPVSEKIIELKEGEAIEQASKPLLKAAGQSALIAITDAQGTIRFINQKFIEVSQYSRQELIGQNHRILKSGFHPPEFYEELWRTISSGKLWRGEIKNRAKDGTFYWVDTSISPILDAGKKIEGYIAIRFLITDKKNFEDSQTAILNILEETEKEKKNVLLERNKLNTIIQSIGEGVVVVDNNRNVILINNVTKSMLGFESAELLGKTWPDIVFLKDEKRGIVPSDKSPLSIALSSKMVSTTTHFYTRKDKTEFPVMIIIICINF